MNQIEDYIIIKNNIPKETCQSLIDECNNRKWDKHQWNILATGKYESAPIKELEVMSSSEEQEVKVKPFIVEALGEYQKKCTWGSTKIDHPPWLSKFVPVRFNKYEVGTMMRGHQDHIHDLFDGTIKGVPIVSIVANLNEDYEGAEFHCRSKIIPLTTGDILLFPSNFMFPHGVTECTKGTRYSFVSWAF
jgi:predicted 2-oxoglutarate/Fe(II)-dependent dioxygenase YbiX